VRPLPPSPHIYAQFLPLGPQAGCLPHAVCPSASSPSAAMHPSTYAHWSLSTARDLTLEAARDASNARKTPARTLPSGQLKKLLDSRAERDVLEGLRRVVTVRRPRPTHPVPLHGRIAST
jgi:hypothetical protein